MFWTDITPQQPGSQVIKMFMLNSAEQEIYVHKYENIKKFRSFFRLRSNTVFLIINVEMPTIVGI